MDDMGAVEGKTISTVIIVAYQARPAEEVDVATVVVV